MLLYLHIPFCDSKCSYCAFNSYTTLHALKNSYMQAITVQLQEDLKRYGVPKKSIETLFIGGGTPSTVSPDLYQPFFDRVRPYLAADAEITTEANPNSATFEWLSGMKELGINRVSFGTQSFNDEKLKLLNRAHSAGETQKAVENAYKAGIEDLSIDLIYATSMDTKELLKEDLKQAFALPINHLSAYALTIEEGTPLVSRPEVAQEKEELTRWLFKQIEAHGFSQYEISNFGTMQSRHNRGYWEYKSYLGIGAGAVGYMPPERLYPHMDVQAYIDDPTFKTRETLTAEDSLTEKVLLGLRSCVGVDRQLLSASQKERADLLLSEDKLFIKGDRLFTDNYLLADELALFLLQ